MTNLERLKLELANKQYFTDDEYAVFLDENGLNASDTYNKEDNQLELLQSVLAVLNSLSNNIELFMKIQTEFTTVSSAYSNLAKRIDTLEKKIAELPNYQSTAPAITYLFCNWLGVL